MAGKLVSVYINGRKVKTAPDFSTDSNGNFLVTSSIPATVFGTVTISANTDKSDNAVVDYPITHSTLFNALVTILKYGFMFLAAVVLLFALRMGYLKYRDPEEIKKLIAKISGKVTNVKQGVRDFMELSHKKKLHFVKDQFLRLIPKKTVHHHHSDVHFASLKPIAETTGTQPEVQ